MDSKKITRLIGDAEKRLKSLDAERNKVLAELEELRREQKNLYLVRETRSLFISVQVTKDSPAEEKISLFYSLFKGREDVFALRWESSRSGKVG